jgi:hypothetical protein
MLCQWTCNVVTVELFFLTERIVYFLNTVHWYNNLEEYCYYEIQIHKALCEFVKKGYCWLKEGLPPRHIRKNMLLFLKR